MTCGKSIRYLYYPSEKVQRTAVMNDPDALECIENPAVGVHDYVYLYRRICLPDSRIVWRSTFEPGLRKTEDGWEPIEKSHTVTVYEYVKENGEVKHKPVEPLIRTENLAVFSGKRGFVGALVMGSVSKNLDTNVILIGRSGKVTVYLNDTTKEKGYNAFLEARESYFNDGRVRNVTDFVDMVTYLEKNFIEAATPGTVVDLDAFRKDLEEKISKDPDFPDLKEGNF